jgi:hypothetical protein
MQGTEIDRDEEIRQLAYKFWQEAGGPDGYEVQHWLKAEAIWREKYGPKSKPKRSKPVKKKKSRKTQSTDTEL